MCDSLRVSKTVFLKEKGRVPTFEVCLSHEKGTIFSQSFLPDSRGNVDYDFIPIHNLKGVHF